MMRKLSDNQPVTSWMQWGKGMPTHTDRSPAEEPYKKTVVKKKRRESMLLSRMHALHKHQPSQG